MCVYMYIHTYTYALLENECQEKQGLYISTFFPMFAIGMKL